MRRYLVRRLFLTIPLLLGVATLVFALIHLVPGDPAQSMRGEGASAPHLTPSRRWCSGSIFLGDGLRDRVDPKLVR